MSVMECDYCGAHVAVELATWRGESAYHEFCEDKMTTTKPFQLGSISTGTLKTEDLIEAFATALITLGSEPPTVVQDETKFDDELHSHHGWLGELEARLVETCPPFVYFGAHPGDGSDFGFWPDWDQLNETVRWAGKSFGPGMHDVTWDDTIIHLNDDGDVTVMDLDRNVIWSTV